MFDFAVLIRGDIFSFKPCFSITVSHSISLSFFLSTIVFSRSLNYKLYSTN
jgi:hypothetical protein